MSRDGLPLEFQPTREQCVRHLQHLIRFHERGLLEVRRGSPRSYWMGIFLDALNTADVPIQRKDYMLDITSRIIDYEAGELSDEDTDMLFQELLDRGLIGQLQGHYGREAQRLLESGRITQRKQP